MAQQQPTKHTLSDEDLSNSLKSIDELASRLSFLISLNSQDRACLPKLHAGHMAFVAEICDICLNSPHFLPNQFNLPQFENDVLLAERLGQLETALMELTARVADTLLSVKSDMYISALEAFGYLQASDEGDGLDSQRKALRHYFRRNRHLDIEEESYM